MDVQKNMEKDSTLLAKTGWMLNSWQHCGKTWKAAEMNPFFPVWALCCMHHNMKTMVKSNKKADAKHKIAAAVPPKWKVHSLSRLVKLWAGLHTESPSRQNWSCQNWSNCLWLILLLIRTMIAPLHYNQMVLMVLLPWPIPSHAIKCTGRKSMALAFSFMPLLLP